MSTPTSHPIRSVIQHPRLRLGIQDRLGVAPLLGARGSSTAEFLSCASPSTWCGIRAHGSFRRADIDRRLQHRERHGDREDASTAKCSMPPAMRLSSSSRPRQGAGETVVRLLGRIPYNLGSWVARRRAANGPGYERTTQPDAASILPATTSATSSAGRKARRSRRTAP